ncbi:MAG: TRAP transporter substrate-binding protein DctP [Thermodesulfobacteriota bacterium]
MKRAFSGMGLCVLAVFVATTVFQNAEVSAQPIELLYGAAEHENGPYCRAMKEYAGELKEKTNGRVNAKFAFGGSLGKMGEFYDLLVRGVCDVALILPTLGNPGSFHMAEIIGLPWVLPRAEITSKALQEYTKRGYVAKDFAKIKLLTASGGHGEFLFTKKKPVASLADLKGLKIHGSTPAIQHKIKLMGGVPVHINLPDLYPALQKGTIDGLIGNWAFMVMFKLSEVTRYATGPGTGGVVFIGTAMKLDTWNKMPADVKGILEGMSDRYSAKYAANWDALCDAGREAFTKEGGKLLEWKAEDLAKMDNLYKPIWEDWIAAGEKKGLPAKKATSDLYGIIKNLGVDPPAIGYKPGP